MYKQGESIRKIAKALGISRNTVRKYLRESDKYPVYRKVKTKGSYLDPYKEYLQARIESAKPEWIPATVLLKEIAAKGYKGKISILRNYIRSFKKVNPEEPVVRFETEPGKQMQIDFVTVSGRKGERFKAFVATLGYSRASFVKFYPNEKTESWIDGVIEACQYFRGVPKEILCDNAKALIIERDAYGEGKHRYNTCLLDLSKYLGFKIKACRPYRPETKGKVERFNSYLKHSFVIPLLTSYSQNGLEVDVDILNAKVGPWLKDVANQRIHGTTNRRPSDLLKHEYEHFLKLPTLKLKSVSLTEPEPAPNKATIKIQPDPNVFDALLTSEVA